MPESEQPIPAQTDAEPVDAETSAELHKWEVWARVELDKEREPKEILAEMIAKGFAADEAAELVERMRAEQEADYEAAADDREQWRAAVSKYRRNMIIGGIYFAGGAAASIKAWLYPGSVEWLVVLGAIAATVFGLLRFAHGLLGYLRPMSMRLEGRYVPGRRIGTYSPATPRSRYSRFT